jgi:hypothetical protein
MPNIIQIEVIQAYIVRGEASDPVVLGLGSDAKLYSYNYNTGSWDLYVKPQ